MSERLKIHVEVERDQHDALVALAAENERSMSAEVRRAIRAHLAEASRPPAHGQEKHT